jgi:glutamate formiminotransferase
MLVSSGVDSKFPLNEYKNVMTIKSNQPLLECVPNFSEGQDQRIINEIAHAISSVDGQKLLHIDSSVSANRTVMTFGGNPEAVVHAAFYAIKTAAQKIDMSKQKGAHPRIGATDVCPLVPLANISREEAIYWSKVLAERVNKEIGLPVYLYEYSAQSELRKSLPQIRKGQYEGLIHKMNDPSWIPDYTFNQKDALWPIAKTGATIIGVRDILVAYNISINTDDVTIAKEIASRIRSSRSVKVNYETPNLPFVRAIGWYMEEYKNAQISINLLNYRKTSPLTVWQMCQSMASEMGVQLCGSEVIGLIPEECILEAGRFSLNLHNKNPAVTESVSKSAVLKEGIKYLELNKIKPFNPREKVLEYALITAKLMDL